MDDLYVGLNHLPMLRMTVKYQDDWMNNGQKMHFKCIFSKINPVNYVSACLTVVLMDHLYLFHHFDI